MVGRHVTPSAAAGEPFVAEYVAELAARLRGPRRRKGRILHEIAEGLVDEISAGREAGRSDEDAKSTAVIAFGSPTAVADAFKGELLASTARWVCAWLLITGPVVGASWLLALSLIPWEAGPAAFLSSVPVAPIVATFALLGTMVLARTGRLTRWVGELSPERAGNATRLLAGGCILVDAAMIGLTLAAGHPFTLLMGLAVLLSGARIGCCIIVLRRV